MNDTVLIRTSLFQKHLDLGAKMVEYSFYEMPVSYAGLKIEHQAVREDVGMFDVSHMGEFLVTGADAALFLDKLLVNSIAQAPVGKAVYSPMCASDGGVVDDLIVYRTGDETFLVCVNAGNIEKDFGWFLKQSARWSLDVQIEDHSDDYRPSGAQVDRKTNATHGS